MRFRPALLAVVAGLAVTLVAGDLYAGKRRCRARACPAPESAPPEIEPVDSVGADDRILTGVDEAQLEADRRVPFSIKGRAVTRAEAFEAVEKGLPDDRHKLRLTAFGTPAQCDAFLRDVQPLAGDVVVQAYRPDDPMVVGLGFARGEPAVYLQRPPDQPGGKGPVEYRWESNPGREAIAAKVEEVRKRDPKYDPARDPNPKQPPPAPLAPPAPEPSGPIDLSKLPPWAQILLALAGGVWLRGKVPLWLELLLARLRAPAPAPAPPKPESPPAWAVELLKRIPPPQAEINREAFLKP